MPWAGLRAGWPCHPLSALGSPHLDRREFGPDKFGTSKVSSIVDRGMRTAPGRQAMKSEPLSLLACKVIMRSKVSSAAKAVGAVLLDHVNWKTYRCDPGEERIVVLSGYVRSTVQSAIAQLADEKILTVNIHGGRFGKNQYDFDWDMIREADCGQAARHRGRNQPEEPGMPRPETRAQTRSVNPFTEPVAQADSKKAPKQPDRGKGQAEQGRGTASHSHPARRRSSTFGPSHSDVAAVSAERRWSADLLDRLRHDLDRYALAVERIDEDLRQAATVAEVRRRGDGVDCVLRGLQQRSGGIG